MRGLRAAMYKDFKLFFHGPGIAAFLLPLLLLLAFQVGMGDLSRQSYIQPFPIGVRDLDNTVMSRSLLSQMARIELFSQVYTLEEDQPDRWALDQGAAAVVTVPKDFFYDLYSMKECPVDVTLNQDMPLESTLFHTIFRSVMDIIRADQSAGLGLYQFCYGELTPQLERQLYASTSEHLLSDALGRQTIFDSDIQQADLQGALTRRLFACVLGVLTIFLAISAVKTLPEELALGVLPRFYGVGGTLLAFAFSKFLSAALLMLPSLSLFILLFRPDNPLLVLLLALILLLGAFGMMLGLSAWTASAAATQRWGNLYLLVALLLSGTLWPRHSLPAPLPAFGRLTLPYYAALGLEAIQDEFSLFPLLSLIWPVLAMGAAGTLLALPGLKKRPRSLQPEMSLDIEHQLPPPAHTERSPLFFPRLANLSILKLRVIAGGYPALAVSIGACLLCGAVAAACTQGSVSTLRLGICDLDDSAHSSQLIQQLEQEPGLSLFQYPHAEDSRRSLLSGEIEGLLIIAAGYEDALKHQEQPPLSYQAAASALSAQGAREIIAGQVVAQRSQFRAVIQAEDHLKRPITDRERDKLSELIDRISMQIPPLFHVQTAEGGHPADPFVPSPIGFSALAVLLTLLTASAWSGSDGKLVERRMFSLPGGRLLSYGSDCLALTGLGVLTALAVLLPGGRTDIPMLLSALCYAFCAAACSLALTRFTTQTGQVDGLAPFIALILCLLGGCFLDLSQFSPMLSILSLAAPPGLALHASGGSLPALAALLGEGIVFFFLGAPRTT